jgi:hypothetical protein
MDRGHVHAGHMEAERARILSAGEESEAGNLSGCPRRGQERGGGI